jgi:hypothetical protein
VKIKESNVVEDSPTLIKLIVAKRREIADRNGRLFNRELIFSGHLKRQPGLSCRRRRHIGIKVKNSNLYVVINGLDTDIPLD